MKDIIVCKNPILFTNELPDWIPISFSPERGWLLSNTLMGVLTTAILYIRTQSILKNYTFECVQLMITLNCTLKLWESWCNLRTNYLRKNDTWEIY